MRSLSSLSIPSHVTHIIFCEGKDDEIFLRYLRDKQGLFPPSIEPVYVGGKDAAEQFITLFKKSSIYNDQVRAYMIVIDADDDFHESEKLCNKLAFDNSIDEKNSFKCPFIEDFAGRIVAGFIMPDNQSAGCLETLIKNQLENDDAHDRVSGLLGSFKIDEGRAALDKRWMQIYLACRTLKLSNGVGYSLDKERITLTDIEKFAHMVEFVKEFGNR